MYIYNTVWNDANWNKLIDWLLKQEACRPDSSAIYNWLSGHRKLIKGAVKHCSKSLIWPLGSHIWSLFAQIHMKSWPKSKLGQIGFEHCWESLIWPIGSLIWSLFAPIHMKSWSKSGQVGVGSNIAQNHSSGPQEGISGHYLPIHMKS